MGKKASKMYDKEKAPKLDRDDSGNVAVKEGKSPTEEEKKTDAKGAGTEGVPSTDHEQRHSHERREIKHRHIKEHLDMHHKHEMEHHHEKSKDGMHERHEKEMKDMHTRHEHEQKAMHKNHGKTASEGGAAEPHAEKNDKDKGSKKEAKPNNAGEKE